MKYPLKSGKKESGGYYKTRPRIATRSEKRKKQEQAYRRLAAKLIREANERGEWCPVVAAVFDGQKARIMEVHHCAGREGELLLKKEHLLPVSTLGHEWIHQHPNEARERGWMYEVKRVGNEWVKTRK